MGAGRRPQPGRHERRPERAGLALVRPPTDHGAVRGLDARTRPLTEIPPCRFGDAGAVSPNMLDEMRDVHGDGFVDLLTSRNAVRTMHGYGVWESAVRVLYRVGADGLRTERCELLP